MYGTLFFLFRILYIYILSHVLPCNKWYDDDDVIDAIPYVILLYVIISSTDYCIMCGVYYSRICITYYYYYNNDDEERKRRERGSGEW